jgi:hypothetical protein
MLWQAICTRDSIKIGGNFTAYHKFDRDPDTLNLSQVDSEKDRPQNMGFAIISKNQ